MIAVCAFLQFIKNFYFEHLTINLLPGSRAGTQHNDAQHNVTNQNNKNVIPSITTFSTKHQA